MKPRLLHVITRLCVGGAQLSMFHLCRDLRDDFEVHIACGPDVGDEGSIYEDVAAEFPTTLLPRLRRAVRPPEDVRVVGDLRQLYRTVQPAIVHTHSSKAGIVGRLAGRRSGLPVVHTVHGWGHTPADPKLKQLGFVHAERIAARYGSRLVAVSSDVRDEGVRLGIGRPEDYVVIPEYVDFRPVRADFEAARASARQAVGLREDVEIVGWVGRFMPQKDPATLASAVARCLESAPQRHAVFIGDGPNRKDVEDALVRAGVADRAHFTGFREDVRRLYPMFDVLLHTSLWEGQPRVIQEAIAERVPVVAARVAGTRPIFEAAPVGFEVEPRDVDAFVQRVEHVLGDAALRAPLAAEAVAEVARRNGRDVALGAHVQLYRELLRTAGSEELPGYGGA